MLILTIVLALTACGGEDPQVRPPVTDPLPSMVSGTPNPTPNPTPSAVQGEVVARTDLGPLPAPRTLVELQRRVAGMPANLPGANRASTEPEQVRYEGSGGDFGIEASDAEDLYPGLQTTPEVFPRLRELLDTPRSCGEPPSYCLQGTSEGQVAVIWGHETSPLVFVARAPDEETLTALLAAWRA